MLEYFYIYIFLVPFNCKKCIYVKRPTTRLVIAKCQLINTKETFKEADSSNRQKVFSATFPSQWPPLECFYGPFLVVVFYSLFVVVVVLF